MIISHYFSQTAERFFPSVLFNLSTFMSINYLQKNKSPQFHVKEITSVFLLTKIAEMPESKLKAVRTQYKPLPLFYKSIYCPWPNKIRLVQIKRIPVTIPIIERCQLPYSLERGSNVSNER